MNSDSFVRFAVIIDKNGNKLDSVKQQGIENFLPSDILDMTIEYAVNSWQFRRSFNQYVGNNQYVLAAYDNVRRVTFPIDDDHLLLVAVDNRGGIMDIIERIQAILDRDYIRPITAGFQY